MARHAFKSRIRTMERQVRAPDSDKLDLSAATVEDLARMEAMLEEHGVTDSQDLPAGAKLEFATILRRIAQAAAAQGGEAAGGRLLAAASALSSGPSHRA